MFYYHNGIYYNIDRIQKELTVILSLDKIKKEAGSIASKYNVKAISLFGSYAEGTASDDSDIDLMVEFDKKAVSLFVLSGIKFDLEEKLQKPVDVIHAPLPKKSMIKADKVINIYG